jgi:hypothetical protein
LPKMFQFSNFKMKIVRSMKETYSTNLIEELTSFKLLQKILP